MSVATHPIQSTNHSTPKKGKHITIHSQRNHSHQSHYHSPNADPSKTQSSFNTLPSSYLRCALLVVMTRACHVSCSSTITHSMPSNAQSTWVEAPSHHFNRNSVPPRHVWSTHVHQLLATNSALGHKQSWQRTNTADNSPARQSPGSLLLRHREARTDQQRVNSHNTASMIARRNQSYWDSQTDLTRRDCSVIHPPLMPVDAQIRQQKPISKQLFK